MPKDTPTEAAASNPMERFIERGLFASRWLLAPFYIGLVGALIVLLCSFVQELVHVLANPFSISANQAVLASLSLIDISLAANLVIIVIFSGYENFVSKFDMVEHKDKPEWHGEVDFSTLKLKLVASIVAISGIQLLKIFMNLHDISDREAMWMVGIHIVFVVSGVLLALMDRIAASTRQLKNK